MITPSEFDRLALQVIRKSVDSLIESGVSQYRGKKATFLDVAPQVYDGVRKFIDASHTLHTLDISPEFSPDFLGDICRINTSLSDNSYDAIFLTEVIEHVLDPQGAIDETLRLLKPGGQLFASSPFNFRIHGPLPDCWRISEHGWRHLLRGYENVIIESEEDISRPLMPIHYRIIAKKSRTNQNINYV